MLALADGAEARPIHVADGPLGARGVQEHDGPAAHRAALERRGPVLDHVAGTAAEQGTGQVVLVVGQRAPQLHEARGAELQARVGEHPVGHARRTQQRGVELLHGDELLVARAVGRHEGRPVEGLQVLGALEVVLEAVEQQLRGAVVEVAQVLAHAALQAHDEQRLGGAVVHRDHGEEVADVLVAVDRRAEAPLKALVPHADAAHGHVNGVVAHAELDVVATDEERHGQAVLLDGGHRDAAVPPGSVGAGHFHVDALVLDHVGEIADMQVPLDATVDARIDHVGHILELARGVLQREHGPVHEGAPIGALRERKQVVGADEALGHDTDVVVHDEDVRVLPRGLRRGHHAAGETARPADVGIGQHGHQVVGERLGVERAAVVHHEHVEAPEDGGTLGADPLLDEIDVRGDVGLLLERSGGEREPHRVHAGGIDLGVPMSPENRQALPRRGDEREADQVLGGAGDLDIQDGRVGRRSGDGMRRDRAAVLRAGRDALDEQVSGARDLDMQAHRLDAGIPVPFARGQRVQVGEEVDRAGANERGGCGIEGRGIAPGAEVELRMPCGVFVHAQKDVGEFERRSHAGHLHDPVGFVFVPVYLKVRTGGRIRCVLLWRVQVAYMTPCSGP